MYVESIEFAGFSEPTQDGGSAGSVVLISGATRIQIPLTVPRRLEMAQSRHRLLLLAKALQKVRRVPQYREQDGLRFAPGVLPTDLRRA